ncbi:hypothetical protein J1605_021240 [Eschrichtius robustus]|uniref:Uncharacterized protein n=1 Tax=Eschrichtius robustus TaxID=9764 RepID=A0AB34HHA6_ESCRO|nr:hypothetical protein J1605_021240 [Eschrichtius robustus]
MTIKLLCVPPFFSGAFSGFGNVIFMVQYTMIFRNLHISSQIYLDTPRGRGFEPWSGKIPHAAEQLGLCTTATEPAHLEPVLRNKRGRDSERPAHRDEEWPPLATTRESPHTETKTQQSQK